MLCGNTWWLNAVFGTIFVFSSADVISASSLEVPLVPSSPFQTKQGLLLQAGLNLPPFTLKEPALVPKAVAPMQMKINLMAQSLIRKFSAKDWCPESMANKHQEMCQQRTSFFVWTQQLRQQEMEKEIQRDMNHLAKLLSAVRSLQNSTAPDKFVGLSELISRRFASVLPGLKSQVAEAIVVTPSTTTTTTTEGTRKIKPSKRPSSLTLRSQESTKNISKKAPEATLRQMKQNRPLLLPSINKSSKKSGISSWLIAISLTNLFNMSSFSMPAAFAFA